MKMTETHHAELTALVTAELDERPGIASRYAAAGLSAQRFMWDSFHAIGRSERGTKLRRELYTYLNDNTVETGLKSIPAMSDYHAIKENMK